MEHLIPVLTPNRLSRLRSTCSRRLARTTRESSTWRSAARCHYTSWTPSSSSSPNTRPRRCAHMRSPASRQGHRRALQSLCGRQPIGAPARLPGVRPAARVAPKEAHGRDANVADYMLAWILGRNDNVALRRASSGSRLRRTRTSRRDSFRCSH